MPALEEDLAAVRGRIEAACRRSGRSPADVRLIGVTKGLPVAAAMAAAEAGLTDLGENYVQELEAKRGVAAGVTWHFLGRLQRNKVDRVVDLADVVHTLEPGRATKRLAGIADAERLRWLVEVDFAGGRVGVPPGEVERFVTELNEEHGVPVEGLMTVAPLGVDPRPVFARMRALRDGLAARFPRIQELSMGMSADLEAAVEEGATMVRVGTAIFGPRPER
jgi:pyridoxal phosphate enzyme (YggS family)